jgi:phage-related tail fiber protein
MKFLAPLDMVKNEIRNFVLHLLASNPGSPTEGQQYHNTTDHHPYYHNGSTFKDLTDAVNLNGQAPSYYLDRTNHTGTQLASTVSDFDTQVRTSRLDQMTAPNAAVSMNSQRLTSLSDPTQAQDAATKAYADALIATGNNKGTVRAASTANVTISNPGTSTFDGVTLSNGDLLLLKDQSTGSQNGLYVFNGSGSALTRATNADTSAEVKAGLFVFVSEGTANGNNGYTLVTDDPITLGTTALTFTQTSGAGQITAGAGLTKTGNQLDVVGTSGRIVANTDSIDLASGIATPGTYESVTVDTYGRVTGGTNPFRVRKYSATIGDGSATSITITQATHGCASDRTNSVFVIDDASGAQVFPDISVASNGNVTIVFAVAPSAAAYRVTILG